MRPIAPSVIWAIDFDEGKGQILSPETIGCTAEHGNFRWLHLSLADQLTRSWIADQEMVPEDLRELLLGPEQHQRAQVEGEWVG